ncbi:hypothetical protein RDABS01_006153, partial [Bienertia sinuspersici]
YVHTGAANVLTFMEADLTKAAARVREKAKDLCHSKSVSIQLNCFSLLRIMCPFWYWEIMVMEQSRDSFKDGSDRNLFCCRAFLGSVSDYCAHHANCSVMIIKKPKNKN